jgi:predicted nucleic acid-binding protein
VSLISLAEIEYGMEVKNWGSARRDLMHRFLARFTALLPDRDTAALWAKIKSSCEKKGRPIPFADAWIAASAVQLNIPLVTHNVGDYVAVESLTILTARAVRFRERKLVHSCVPRFHSWGRFTATPPG